MVRKFHARESVGDYHEFQLLEESGTPVNIAGCVFAQSFARQQGAIDFTLGMAAAAGDEGFFITDAAAGKYQRRILAATLQGVDDTTGDFTAFGDLLITFPDGSRVWIEDHELQVTEGPTA